MMRALTIFFFIVTSIANAGPLDASHAEGSPAQNEAAETHFAVAPMLSPNTGFGLSAVHLLISPAKDPEDQTHRSYMTSYVSVTQKSQLWVSAEPTHYWDHGQNEIEGALMYKVWPDQFYGVGLAQPSAFENYTAQSILARAQYYRKLTGSNWSAGPAIEFRDDVMTYVSPGGLLAQGFIPGSQGGLQVGPTLAIQYDDRDNNFYASHGLWLLATAAVFPATSSKAFTYSRYVVDLRSFHPITGRQTFVLQGYLRSTTGSVPFQSLSYLGGNQLLRGYYQGQYLNNDVVVVQGEYRFPLFWRFNGTVFGGIGETTNQFNILTRDTLQSDIGVGLRIRVTNDGLNLRLDYGQGPNTSGLYVAVGEAI